ncbi:hypothetical protein, variant 1 [Exophiala mesophila]|uniref:MalT-like TPR region domain-containing protein n=1 Tax=Exophiala mesophila TaxID=212818 RepID=A0A0D1ZA85_EXOME|nr:hypothetical protein, variant 1 [Exophiala mesophila]KIV91577.1 hypothetical protein, variant 1 [Exophiala mesophila]
MASCLCGVVNQLANEFNDEEAQSLASDLNKHLGAIQTILKKSKALSQNVRYQVVPTDQRTGKILSIRHLVTTEVRQICDRLDDEPNEFWMPSDNSTHAKLHRRLACVVIYLRSSMRTLELVPPRISSLVQGMKVSELRYAGRKYLKIARKVGSIGSILWLPLDVPASTYERYLTMDDEPILAHLQSLIVHMPDYTDFVRRVVASQLDDPSPTISHYNLAPEHGDILQSSDLLLLLIFALGGIDVPRKLLESVRFTKRRWTAEGEIEELTATDFGLPHDIVSLLSHDLYLSQIAACPNVKVHSLDDGTAAFSIMPEERAALSKVLSPQTQEYFFSIAIRLICFATPPPLEGNTSWPVPFKEAVWILMEKLTEQQRVTALLRTQVVDTLFFFGERDSLPSRRIAIDRARALLTESMPYYFHAGMALFESILLRLEGNLVKSISRCEDFLSTSPSPSNRLENALRGRLHISLIESKIQRYDHDIAARIYAWEGSLPLSSLENEVTRRLQGAASRFFQSIGDFANAKASLEQHLSLESAKPMRHNTRLLLVGRLAEVYCELGQSQKALELLQPVFESIPQSERKGRPYRRLLLAFVEASMSNEDADATESALQYLADIEPQALDDMNDQTLHMRRMIAKARAIHVRQNYPLALEQWKLVLQSMGQLHIFQSKHPWTAALIHLSLAHAQLSINDLESGKASWARALEISTVEPCEYNIIPLVANVWLPKIVSEVHRRYGWPFRMKVPGGNPDATWP